jgi:Domain of unknown function (DUF4386)
MTSARVSTPTSLRSLARLGGVLYLVTIAMGLYRELYVKGQILVPGDIAATADRLGQSVLLWRTGIAAELVMVVCGVVLTWVLYLLLRPTDARLALLMAYFSLVALAVESASAILLVQATIPGSATYMRGVDPALRHALVGTALRSHEYGFGIALLMFGPFFLIAGHLIWRSRLFPKVVGALYQVSGVGYLIHSFVLILVPAAAGAVFTVVALPIFVGEFTFCLWLLFKRLDDDVWSHAPVADAP